MDRLRKNIKLKDMMVSLRKEVQDAAEESLRIELSERVTKDEYLRIMSDPKFFDETVFLSENLYSFMKFVFHYLWHKKHKITYIDDLSFAKLYDLICITDAMIAKPVRDYTNRFEVDDHINLMKAVSEHMGHYSDIVPKLKSILETRMKIELYEMHHLHEPDLNRHLKRIDVMKKDLISFNNLRD